MKIQSDWSAAWIWSQEDPYKINTHWLFRTTFNCGNNVDDAVLKIVGQQRYEVFINGQFVGRGPGAQSDLYANYDTFAVGTYLKPGKNVITAKVYFCEESPMPYAFRIYSGKPGLLAQINCGDHVVCATNNDSWLVTEDLSYSRQGQRITTWGAYHEHYDVEKAIPDLHAVKFNTACWKKATVVDSPVKQGCLQVRQIPSLRHTTVYPQQVYSQTNASCYEYDISKQDILGNENLYAGVEGVCTLRQLASHKSPRLVLDFGRVRAGYLHININSGKGRIDLSLGESLHTAFTDTIKLNGQKLNYVGFERRSMRYLVLEVFDITEPVEIEEIFLEQVEYPFEPRGNFKCSDAALDKIWETAGMTVQACSYDFFEDCPWREQALWMGDVQIAGRIAAYQFGDMRLSAESMERIAAIAHPDGWLPSVGPGYFEMVQSAENFLPDHSLDWILCVSDYYLFTGDMDFINKMYPVALGLADYYIKQLDKNYLLGNCTRPEWWCFVDWTDKIDRRDYVAAIQMHLVEAMREMSTLSEVAGNQEKSIYFADLAGKMTASINKYFWSERAKGYVDCVVGRNYKQSLSCSRQTNVLAIVWKVANSMQRKMIYKQILSNPKLPPIKTGFFNHYTIRACFDLGLPDEALRIIKGYWGKMLDRGATTFWESFDPDSQNGKLPERLWSLCHGFSCAPGYVLQSEMLGIKPMSPGWKKVHIAPQIGSISDVSGRVPTLHGEIDVAITQNQATYSFQMLLPKDVEAVVELPLGKSEKSGIVVNGRKCSFSVLKKACGDLELLGHSKKAIKLKIKTNKKIRIDISK